MTYNDIIECLNRSIDYVEVVADIGQRRSDGVVNVEFITIDIINPEKFIKCLRQLDKENG